MRDCKIIQLQYSSAVHAASRKVKTGSFGGNSMDVAEYPAAEKEINVYLAQGYRIVNSFFNDGLWFILERG